MDITDQMRKDARTSYGHFSPLWWIGVPVFVILVSYGPFLLMNCILHAGGNTCWRVQTIGQIIFDFGVYSSFLTSAAVGLTGAADIPVLFVSLFRVSHLLVPEATVSELWLFYRICFGILSWWMASWTLSSWSDLTKRTCRIAASILWIAVFLPLGFRQGAFSWFIPFILLALAACMKTLHALERRKIGRAALWTILGLLSATVYPWCAAFAAFWFTSLWVEWAVFHLRRRWIVTAWAGASLLAIGTSLLFVLRFGHATQAIMDRLIRNGLAFTHMPMLSTMLFAAIAWFIAIFILALRSKGESSAKEFTILLRTWVVTILAWCSSLFMGIFFQNDHFRLFVLLFAWISTVVLLHWMHGIDAQKGRGMTFMVALAAAIASFAYIAKPYALDHDQLNTIHLFVWLSLALVSACLVWSKWATRLHPRTIAIMGIVLACCIGFPQYAVMFASENSRWEAQQSYKPLFAWMKTSIPEQDVVCADPIDADFAASQSGHVVFFTEQDVFSLPRQTLYDRLEAFASIRHVDDRTASDWTGLLQTGYVACGQFSLQRSALDRVLPSSRVEQMLGCDQKGMKTEADYVKYLSTTFGTENQSTPKICPWILVNTAAKSEWSIPNIYTQAYADGKFEVYRVGK